MIQHTPQTSDSIQCSIAILQKAVERLERHDYASAHVMVGVAKQILTDVQTDLNDYVSVRQQLRALLQE